MFEAWAQQHGQCLHSRTTLYTCIDKELINVRFSFTWRD